MALIGDAIAAPFVVYVPYKSRRRCLTIIWFDHLHGAVAVPSGQVSYISWSSGQAILTYSEARLAWGIHTAWCQDPHRPCL